MVISNLYHRQVILGPGELISVRVNERSKIRLIDDENFRRFQAGHRYRYLGRSAARLEATLRPERQSRSGWHLVIIPDEPEVELSAEVNIFS